jgi:enoyl-CoA hydratase
MTGVADTTPDLWSVPPAADASDGVAVLDHDGIAEVVLSRPEVHNAVNLAMWTRLSDVFRGLARRSDIRVVIVRGAGRRAFSAGADIGEFRTLRIGIEAADRYNRQVADALEAISATPQAVVAMISGLAVGGGCEIATVCDVRIAGSDARLGIPVARLGVTLGQVEAAALVGLVGPGRAKDLLLTGRLVTADEALLIGLLDRVVPPDDLGRATWQTALSIAAAAPLAAIANKLTVNAIASGSWPRAAEEIRRLTADVYNGQDLVEGVTAFLEKRDPKFTGR